MTVIAAVVDGGRAWMGGDTHTIGGGGLVKRAARPKVVRKEVPGPAGPSALLVGTAGTDALGALVDLVWQPPPPGEAAGPDYAWACSRSLVELVEAQAIKRAVYDEDGLVDGYLLLAWRGRLYEMDDTLTPLEHDDGYAAVGSGADLALGALFATAPPRFAGTPAERLRLALDAAARHREGIGPPGAILSDEP